MRRHKWRLLPVGRLAWRLPAALVAAVLATSCGVAALSDPTISLEVSTGTGEELVFVPDRLQLPPLTTAAVTFANRSHVPHNLVFVTPVEARTREIVAAGNSERIVLQTPDAGTYRFVCTIHEAMEGTLVVR